MAKKIQHVIPLGNGWAVKKEGSNDFLIITEKQKDAVKVAREIAKNDKSEIIIHDKDGKVKDTVRFGSAPKSPADKK